MRTVAGLLILSLVACTQPRDVSEARQRTRVNTTPQTTPQNSPRPSGSLWTQAEIDSTTNSCASKGTANGSFGFTQDQWQKWCRCLYQTASRQWSLADFTQNYDYCFNELLDDGTVDTCFQEAGMM